MRSIRSFTPWTGEWWPALAENRYELPDVGAVIGWEHRALEVMRVRPQGERDPQHSHLGDRRAARLIVRRLYGPPAPKENEHQEFWLHAPAHARFHHYPDGIVPLCSCCGHPWPCRNVVAIDESAKAAELLDQRLAKIAPGFCYGCGEPITHRQNAIRYTEPNVQVPGAPPPVFHARLACRGWVDQYERDRVKALDTLAAEP